MPAGTTPPPRHPDWLAALSLRRRPCRWQRDRFPRGDTAGRWVCANCGVEAYAMGRKPAQGVQARPQNPRLVAAPRSRPPSEPSRTSVLTPRRSPLPCRPCPSHPPPHAPPLRRRPRRRRPRRGAAPPAPRRPLVRLGRRRPQPRPAPRPGHRPPRIPRRGLPRPAGHPPGQREVGLEELRRRPHRRRPRPRRDPRPRRHPAASSPRPSSRPPPTPASPGSPSPTSSPCAPASSAPPAPPTATGSRAANWVADALSRPMVADARRRACSTRPAASTSSAPSSPPSPARPSSPRPAPASATPSASRSRPGPATRRASTSAATRWRCHPSPWPASASSTAPAAARDATQVLSRDWIDASLVPRTRSPFSGLDYGYGWFLGRARGHPFALARGYGGQLIAVVPDLALTVAITSDPTRPARSEGYFGELMRLLADTIVPEAEAA